jgi:hypothetical protein
VPEFDRGAVPDTHGNIEAFPLDAQDSTPCLLLRGQPYSLNSVGDGRRDIFLRFAGSEGACTP